MSAVFQGYASRCSFAERACLKTFCGVSALVSRLRWRAFVSVALVFV